ncbi:MAG: hypothetical protein P4L39_05760 [Humidesulfovibrio sp.]|nr:hypothetical protein [Humidesulfovibrio sp.]
MEQQGSRDDRKCVRVTVPQSLLLDGALWVRPAHVPTHLHLLELGRPDLRFTAVPPCLRIEDLSANGLRITLMDPKTLGQNLDMLKSGPCLVFLHLKLSQPLSAVEDRPLSLLLGVTPVAVREEEDGQLVVALNILYRGQPDRDDKSLTFFYVAKYPIRELAAWCDEVTLMDRVPQRPIARGLRMDRFLLELDTVLTQAESQAAGAIQDQGQ